MTYNHYGSLDIVFIDTYYQDFLRVEGFDQLVKESNTYKKEISALGALGFGTGMAYVKAFEDLGWRAELVVANSLRTQTSWAREHLSWTPINFGWQYGLHIARLPIFRNYLHRVRHMHRVLLEQIKEMKPHVVVVQDINLIPPAFTQELKKHCTFLIGEIASPPPPGNYFLEYDLIISALPSILELCANLGVPSHYVPLAFDEKWSNTRKFHERDIDAIFVGSISRHQPETIPLLREVASRVENFHIYGPGTKNLMEANGLALNYKGEAWGQQMFDLLSRSKIVLNRHGTVAGPYAVNMRMYEATGSGALLVTEEKENLSSLFVPGSEVLTYRTFEEAGVVIKKALEAPKSSSEVAKAGHLRTMNDHTYLSRARLIQEIILNL